MVSMKDGRLAARCVQVKTPFFGELPRYVANRLVEMGMECHAFKVLDQRPDAAIASVGHGRSTRQEVHGTGEQLFFAEGLFGHFFFHSNGYAIFACFAGCGAEKLVPGFDQFFHVHTFAFIVADRR